jgi:hypothetical protein
MSVRSSTGMPNSLLRCSLASWNEKWAQRARTRAVGVGEDAATDSTEAATAMRSRFMARKRGWSGEREVDGLDGGDLGGVAEHAVVVFEGDDADGVAGGEGGGVEVGAADEGVAEEGGGRSGRTP